MEKLSANISEFSLFKPLYTMMTLDRTVIRKGDMHTVQEDGFVQMSMKRRVDMVWEMTLALWEIST